MKIATGWSTAPITAEAFDAAYKKLLVALGEAPSYMIVYASVEHSVDELLDALKHKAPDIPVHGGSSCLGVMSAEGFHQQDGVGLGLFGIYDPDGDYGVGIVPIHDNARAAGAKAIEAAIADAGRMGEPPDLVWLNSVPGSEEDVLLGIQDVLGENVPVAGGSVADNTVSGGWYQFTHNGTLTNAVLVTALYPSRETHLGFYSGYTPASKTGIATRAEGRTVFEIDGKPAASVYNQWTGGTIGDFLQGGNILMSTTLHPLGRVVGQVGQLPYYQLSHPEAVTQDGGIAFFSEIKTGDKLTLMRGSIDSLVLRAGRVAEFVLQRANLSKGKISGALIVYCAGCMLTVQEEMEYVAAEIRDALGEVPFLGVFTFGEQGCFIHGENRHGNLMISVVVFE